MKKTVYAVVDECGADIWTEKHETEEEAIKSCVSMVDGLTDSDLARRDKIYVAIADEENGEIDFNSVKEIYNLYPLDISFKDYPVNVQIFMNNQALNIDTDGIEKTDDDAEAHDYAEADADTVESSIRRLTKAERRKIVEHMEDYYLE